MKMETDSKVEVDIRLDRTGVHGKDIGNNEIIEQKTSNLPTHTNTTEDKVKKYKCDHENFNENSENRYCPDMSRNTDTCNTMWVVKTQSVTEREQTKTVHNADTSNDKRQKYKCETCNTYFYWLSHYTLHMRTHTGEKPYKCDTCGKAFAVKSVLNKHVLKTHTNIKPFLCDTCGEGFPTKADLKKHVRLHTGEKPYKCHICGECFAQNYHLKVHRRTHKDVELYKCDTCDKTFTTEINLKKHTKSHTGEKIWKCETCGKYFTSQAQLTSHIRSHTGERPFKCITCGNCYFTKSCLTKHMRLHTGEKPYKCTICGNRFNCNSSRKKHERTHTGEKPFECSTCGKCFTTSGSLKLHITKHTGANNFKCELCEMCYKTKGGLQNHMLDHTMEKKFKCERCHAGFISERKLEVHIKTLHKAQKLWECITCEMIFNTNQNYVIHMRKHTGERPFKCETCGKTYISKGQLKRHSAFHINESERPFKCTVCNKGFTEAAILRIHMRSHTKEKPYKCNICEKGFSRQEHVKSHAKIHMKIQEEQFKCDECGERFPKQSRLCEHWKTYLDAKAYKCYVCGMCFIDKASRNKHRETDHTGPLKSDNTESAPTGVNVTTNNTNFQPMGPGQAGIQLIATNTGQPGTSPTVTGMVGPRQGVLNPLGPGQAGLSQTGIQMIATNTGQLGSGQVVIAQPGSGLAVIGQPVFNQLGSGQIVLTQPGSGQVALGQLGPGHVVLNQMGFNQPVINPLVSGQSNIGHLGSGQAIVNMPSQVIFNQLGSGQGVFGPSQVQSNPIGVNQLRPLKPKPLSKTGPNDTVSGLPAPGDQVQTLKALPTQVVVPSSNNAVVINHNEKPVVKQENLTENKVGTPLGSGQSALGQQGLIQMQSNQVEGVNQVPPLGPRPLFYIGPNGTVNYLPAPSNQLQTMAALPAQFIEPSNSTNALQYECCICKLCVASEDLLRIHMSTHVKQELKDNVSQDNNNYNSTFSNTDHSEKTVIVKQENVTENNTETQMLTNVKQETIWT